MSILATKPAPMALGARDIDGGGNRVELLARKNPLVTQLLEDFVSQGGAARQATRTAPTPPPAAPPAPAATPMMAKELIQLRARVEQLETRLKAIEASACKNEPMPDPAKMNDRVVAVLEQLIAELRERA